MIGSLQTGCFEIGGKKKDVEEQTIQVEAAVGNWVHMLAADSKAGFLCHVSRFK